MKKLIQSFIDDILWFIGYERNEIEERNRLRKNLRTEMKELHLAYEFYNKFIKNSVPEKWEPTVSKGLFRVEIVLFHHDSINDEIKEDKPLISFANICKLFEKFSSGKPDKNFDNGFNIWCETKYKGVSIGLRAHQMQTDKCEIEYIEEVVKKPVLTGFCAEILK